MGSVVVSIDYFKRIWAALRTILGGRVRAYETVLDRGRREAILRMKEEAARFGAQAVVNVRIETSQLSNVNDKNKGIGACEILAYGTAVKDSLQQSLPSGSNAASSDSRIGRG